MRVKGFTLAEILITIGIVGVVAALTLPTIITNIQNKGYVEKLKKSYSLLQQSTNLVADELGVQPQNWEFYKYTYGEDYTDNVAILNAYAKNLKFTKKYGFTPRGYNDYLYYVIQKKGITYYYLNGEANAVLPYASYRVFACSNVVELSDGITIGFVFSQNPGGANMWDLITPNIPILFVVDVNGLAKPNKIGRDVFFFYLKDGKIVPNGIEDMSDCTKNDKGYSCAAKVILEGKMDY